MEFSFENNPCSAQRNVLLIERQSMLYFIKYFQLQNSLLIALVWALKHRLKVNLTSSDEIREIKVQISIFHNMKIPCNRTKVIWKSGLQKCQKWNDQKD